MPKEKNKTNKKQKIKEVEDIDILDENTDVSETTEEEALPEDVQDALGMNKAEKAARINEVDYVSELENGFGDFDDSESDSKSGFDDFDSDLD